jgi:UMP-CMP kinase
MESSDAKRVLIDGFPRCEENRIAFERIVSSVSLLLYRHRVSN